jgi:hypothetical protein
MHYGLIALSIVAFLVAITAHADEPEERRLPHGSIAVHLKGDLVRQTSFKSEADREGTVFAYIDAGGATIELDWNNCQAIQEELVSFDRGDGALISGIHAEVTGRLKFVPFERLVAQNPLWKRMAGEGISDGTPMPVVLVESIQIQLLPKTAHRARRRVVSTTTGNTNH